MSANESILGRRHRATGERTFVELDRWAVQQRTQLLLLALEFTSMMNQLAFDRQQLLHLLVYVHFLFSKLQSIERRCLDEETLVHSEKIKPSAYIDGRRETSARNQVFVIVNGLFKQLFSFVQLFLVAGEFTLQEFLATRPATCLPSDRPILLVCILRLWLRATTTDVR